jgi:hypothetical protein
VSSCLLYENMNIKIWTRIVLPDVLYGRETWYLTLREENRLGVSENRVLRRTFGYKGGKVKLSLCLTKHHAKKTCWALDGGEWSASFPGRFTPQGKSTWYPLSRSLGRLQSRSGPGGEEKNSQPPLGIEPYNPDRPARSPALYRLSYHGS